MAAQTPNTYIPNIARGTGSDKHFETIMILTQRRATIALFSLQTIGAILGLIYLLIEQRDPSAQLGLMIGAPVCGGLLLAYLRGWEPARYANLIFVTLLVAGPLIDPISDQTISTVYFIPPALALVLGGPVWVGGTGLAVAVILIVRAGGQGLYSRGDNLLGYAVSVGALVVGRLIVDYALSRVAAEARLARDSQAQAEAHASAAAAAAAALQEQVAQQRQLLELVATLETPAVTLADGVLFAPIVGQLDCRRAETLTRKLLDAASAERARLVILDIAGVSAIDTAVAQSLLDTAGALRLLGCEVAISGISAAVALRLIHLDASLAGVRTIRTPQEALHRSQ